MLPTPLCLQLQGSRASTAGTRPSGHPRHRGWRSSSTNTSRAGDPGSSVARDACRSSPSRCCVAEYLRSLADDAVPEEQVRLILVVRPAAELDVVRGAYPSHRGTVRRDGTRGTRSRGTDLSAQTNAQRPSSRCHTARFTAAGKLTPRGRAPARAGPCAQSHGLTCSARDGRSAPFTPDRGSGRRLHPVSYVGRAPARAAACRASRATASPVVCSVPVRVASRQPRGGLRVAAVPCLAGQGGKSASCGCGRGYLGYRHRRQGREQPPLDGDGASRRMTVAAAGRGFNNAISS